MLIFDPATLLKVFLISERILVESLESFYYNFISSTNSNNFSSFKKFLLAYINCMGEFLIFIIIVLLGGGILEYFQKLLQCIKYIRIEFTPSSALFHPHSPNS
jgi:hypothetical protein